MYFDLLHLSDRLECLLFEGKNSEGSGVGLDTYTEETFNDVDGDNLEK